MRRTVPFIGEELIVRSDKNTGDTDQENLLDELLDNEADSSSWDEWPSRAPGQPHTSVSRAVQSSGNTVAQKKAAPVAAQIDWKPINNGHCLRISISGKLDLQARGEWQRFIRETSASRISQFEFNLTQTPELSLTGLGMLLLFKDQKKSQRQDIKLSHCNHQIHELLQWTGMDKYFLIQPKPGD